MHLALDQGMKRRNAKKAMSMAPSAIVHQIFQVHHNIFGKYLNPCRGMKYIADARPCSDSRRDDQKAEIDSNDTQSASFVIFIFGFCCGSLLNSLKFTALAAAHQAKWNEGSILNKSSPHVILFILSDCNLMVFTIIWRLAIFALRKNRYSQEESKESYRKDIPQRAKSAIWTRYANLVTFGCGAISGAGVEWIILRRTVATLLVGTDFIFGELIFLFAFVVCSNLWSTAVVDGKEANEKINTENNERLTLVV